MGNTGAAYVGEDLDGVRNDEVGKPQQGRRAGQRVLPTKDGFAAMMIWPFAPHWDKVIAAFQITEAEFQDNKSKEGLARVTENYRGFLELLEQKFAALTNAEIDTLASDFDLPLGVVVDIDEFQHHPQIKHMESLVTHQVGTLGIIREPRPAPLMSATPLKVGGAAPQRGEHTVEILKEYGFSTQQRASLRAEGVFGRFGDE